MVEQETSLQAVLEPLVAVYLKLYYRGSDCSMEALIYCFSSKFRSKNFKKNKGLPRCYTFDFNEDEGVACAILDTFDNALLRLGIVLLQTEEFLVAIDLRHRRIVEQLKLNRWLFVAELEAGPVTSLLSDVSPLRALTPVAAVTMLRGRGNILDDEGKTRARFHSVSLQHGEKRVTVGCTRGLRGYDKAHADLKKWLQILGGVICGRCGELYTRLGVDIEEYRAKPHLQINGNDPVKETATTIIKTYLQVARANEEGIIANIDTEFLHDFRVSLRKIRSVLSLFKGIYGHGETRKLKSFFSDLTFQTNRLRDLDVYLLNKDEYYELVPVTSHGGLDILFAGLEKDRENEQKKVAGFLQSKDYRRRLRKLQKLFRRADNIEGGPGGEERTFVFACRVILKRYRNVCGLARTIDTATPDEVVHRLRIHCKKLRYSMEFFAPLFAESDIKKLIKSLKRLQDNLGKFNDYSVQQTFLKDILTRRSSWRGKEILMAESIGALTAMLYQLQRLERAEVVNNFARFDGVEMRRSYKRLFKRR